ncbi:MAG: ABC transporter substrate-binding protein [Dehalococcoidia bacterium]
MTQGYGSRPRGRRVGRRTVLGAGAVAGATAFLAACSGGSASNQQGSSSAGPDTGGTTAASEGTPKPGGQLREATITQAPHFSPYHPGADPSIVNFWRRDFGYYEPLWGLKTADLTGSLVDLRAAASYEQPDPATVIATMHPVKFHNRPPANGRDLVAEDVVAMVDFLKVPPASGGAFIQSGKDLKSVSAVDAQTVRFETFGPRAFFFEEGGGQRPIVPREMLDEKTLKETTPVGSGPYQYKTHTQGSVEEVTRFEGFRVPELPYITERKLTFVPDVAAMEAAFRSGQIDLINYEGITNIKQKEALERDLGSRIMVKTNPSTSGMALVVNVNRAPWNDIRVREAIYRAIDIDRVLNVVYFGDGERSWYFSKARTTRFPLGPEPVQQYIGYDPKKAADLLKQSGIDLTKEYEFMVPVEAKEWVDAGRLMAEDLAAVGLKTRVNPVVRNIYLQRAGPKPGDFDITMSVMLDYEYAQTNSGTFWDSTSLQDPEVDAIIGRIKETVDDTQREQLSHEFETMLARKYSNFIPVMSGNWHYAWYSSLKGFDSAYQPAWYQKGRWLNT